MDIQPTNQQAISDDQELAKVLAGVNDEVNQAEQVGSEPAIPPAPSLPTPDPVKPADSAQDPAKPADDVQVPATPDVPTPPLPETPPVEPVASPENEAAPVVDGALSDIKQAAIGELRPLIDKLDVKPQEKFDAYLMLLRSTDDKDLIAPAHEAAKLIDDEAHRAQALLDVIKEIDFLSNKQ